MKIKNIIALTDFSEHSSNAVLYAAKLLKDKGLKIILLNIFEKPKHKTALLISVEDILSKDSKSALKKQSEQIGSILNDKKIDISTHSEEGELKTVIHDIIDPLEHPMIVTSIPSGKYPVISPLLFIGQSNYPVLFVPEMCTFKPLRDIVLLHDGVSINQSTIGKTFYSVIPKEKIKGHRIRIHRKDIDTLTPVAPKKKLLTHETDIIVIISSPGNEIDRALMEYRIKNLIPSIEPILNRLG